MDKKEKFTRFLAVTGTVLVWFPILAPVLLTIIFLITNHELRFDFMMPAGLALFALVGGALLLWAAFRKRSRIKLFGWGLGAAVFMLFGAQGLAVVTGLAHGETEPEGVWYITAITMINLYTVAVMVLGIGGIALLKELFGKRKVDETGNT